MAVQNKLFKTGTINRVSLPSRQRLNREYMLSASIAEELNTYKNFGIFPTYNDVGSTKWNEKYESKDYDVGTPGVRSIFNRYSAVLTGADSDTNITTSDRSITTQAEGVENLVKTAQEFRLHNNVPLLDTPHTRRMLREMSGCSVKELVTNSHKGYYGRATYDYADFMYCKYLGKVPNNQLITLRRYPAPVLDSTQPYGKGKNRRTAGESKFFAPIGTMVTWMGVSGNEMQNLLKYEYNMAFEEKSAKWEDVSEIGGGGGLLGGMEAAMNSSTRKAFNQGYSVPALDNFVGKFFKYGASGPYSYNDGSRVDANKVYGPIDRVKKNYMRSEAGLDWKMSFDVVFEYELRAYNGINPRQAMLDLISNILSVTYVTGGFWGGGYRGGGLSQSSAFNNLEIFKAHGGFTDYIDAISTDLSNGMTAVKDYVASQGGILETIKTVANMVGGMLMGSFLNNLGRPKKTFANSLLSEAPVGLWHLTFGNPNHPIMSMGNMILKNTKIEHSGPLGLDDFPTYLKVTCSFDRGKPRDQVGVESIYLHGNDRIAHSMSKKLIDMYQSSSIYKNKSDGTNYSSFQAEADSETTSDTGSTTTSSSSSITYLDYCFGSYDTNAVITPSREQAEGAFKKSSSESTSSSSK